MKPGLQATVGYRVGKGLVVVLQERPDDIALRMHLMPRSERYFDWIPEPPEFNGVGAPLTPRIQHTVARLFTGVNILDGDVRLVDGPFVSDLESTPLQRCLEPVMRGMKVLAADRAVDDGLTFIVLERRSVL
jgi:hypothetical protein